MENLIKLITENPHRILGVYANSSAKEIANNKGKALAYSKVSKDITFSTDLSCLMTPLTRTMENINEACVQVMSEERLRYAQFWFMRIDATDEDALAQLSFGDMDNALRIWGAQETVSSLHNQMICYILQADLATAISIAETLYEQYGDTYIQQLDKSNMFRKTESDVACLFLETLGRNTELAPLFEYCQTEEWKDMIRRIVFDSVYNDLSTEIEKYRNADHKNLSTLKMAGEELMEKSKKPLQRLKKVLKKKDPQYQDLADRVGMEILNCCIEYVNMSTSDIYDSVHSTYKLLVYAKYTIVGPVATRRFEENYEMVKPILNLSKEEYQSAVQRPFKRKLRWGIVLGIMLCIGIVIAIIEGEFSGFWRGMAIAFPLCLLVNRIMLSFE